MKKILIILGCIFAVILILIMNFGIQIGDVRLGKQDDTLVIRQDIVLENSSFATTYLDSDSIICVNLWATWCEPCLEEVPMLNEIKQIYSGKNVSFLSFSVDTDSVKLVQFNEGGKFKFKDITLENLAYKTAILNFLNEKPRNNKVSSYTVPATYLIKDKKVAHKIIGGIGGKLELTKEIDVLLD